MTEEETDILADAFMEHTLKYDWSRVLPRTFTVSHIIAMVWYADTNT